MSRRRIRSLLPTLLLLAAVSAGVAGETDRLREITERWRQGRVSQVPLEAYLRRLVASDRSFRADSTLGPERLGDEMRQTWYGLQVLLKPTLQQQFLGLSSDSLRSEWLRRYWRLRDPTPTTPENERLREHEQRVAVARRDFAWKEPPGWDARGRIEISFGEPDSIVDDAATIEEGLGYVPAHQVWMYLDEKFLVELQRPNPRGPWVLGRSSASLSSRPDIVARDARRLGLDQAPQGASDYERRGDLLEQQRERAMLAQGDYEHLDPDIVQHEIRTDLRARDLMRRKEEALVKGRSKIESSSERFLVRGTPKLSIWYVFDVTAFKGSPGSSRVEVHYQFNLQDLKFGWKDSLYVASYRVEGVLLDSAAREAARDAYTETIKSEQFRPTQAAQLIPGQLVFEVPEGDYRLAVRFVDVGSESEGTYVTDISVPRLDGRELALSDVQMASKIVYAGDDWRSRFVKRDRLIIPNPIRAYQRGHQLTGYFEIYGLALDATGVCHYEVTYSILPRAMMRPEGWFPAPGPLEKPYVRSSFKGDGGTSDLNEDLRIDVGSLGSDAYDLVLTVRDLVAGTEATSRSSFTILD